MEATHHMLVTTKRQPDIEQTAQLLVLAIDMGRGTSQPVGMPDDAALDVRLLPCSPTPDAARYRVAISATGTGIAEAPEARIDVIAGNAVAVFPDPDAEDGWGRAQASLHDEAGVRRVVQAAIDSCTRLMRPTVAIDDGTADNRHPAWPKSRHGGGGGRERPPTWMRRDRVCR